jgi:glycosyltransferase involved in cell wall biosynthesis
VKLSILMPVYNEAATLQDALDRVLAVDYPCEVELVVVDDGASTTAARCWRRRPTRG